MKRELRIVITSNERGAASINVQRLDGAQTGQGLVLEAGWS